MAQDFSGIAFSSVLINSWIEQFEGHSFYLELEGLSHIG